MSYCVAFNCSNTTANSKGRDVTFHRFPKDPSRRAEWAAAVGRKNWSPTNYSHICSEHFKEHDIERTPNKRTLILPTAIPSVFDRSPVLNLKRRKLLDNEIIATTPRSLLDSSDTPRKTNEIMTSSNQYGTSLDLATQSSTILDSSDTPCKVKLRACAVFGCESVRRRTRQDADDENRLGFHKFPRSPEIRKQWVWACKRADDFNPDIRFVCSKHFSKNDYQRDLKSELMDEYKPKHILKPSAVPHLKLPGQTPEKESVIKRKERYAKKLEREEREKFIKSIFEESTPPLNPEPECCVQPELITTSSPVKLVTISPSVNLLTISPSVQPRPILPSTSSQPAESDVHEQLRLLQTKVSVLEKRLEEEKRFRLEMCSRATPRVSQLPTNIEDDSEEGEEIDSPDESSCDSDDLLEDSEKMEVVIEDSTEEISCDEAQPSFVCSTCDSFFDSWELLNQHIKNQHFEKDLKEKEVNDHIEEFVIESIETEDKANEQIGECKVCKRLFTLKALRKHEQTHDKEKPYICSFCDKTFAQLAYMKKHELCHTGEKPFECETCHRTFAQKSNLKLHERVHSRKLKCRFRSCNERFPFRRSLLYHERTHKNGPFDCSYCDRSFTKIDEFRFHEMTHTNEKPYRCSECGEEFLSKHSLQLHTINHSGKNPFKCEICDRVLSSKNSLSIHRLKHTGEKPYKCKLCHFETAFVGTLKAHTRMHSGEKPYKCRLCKKAFTYNMSLKIHMQTHSDDKLFKCQWCPKQFTTSTKLKNHSQNKHPNELEEQNLVT